MQTLLAFIVNDKLDQAEARISLMLSKCENKPEDINLTDCTVGYFKTFLKKIGYSENVNLSESRKRSSKEKVEAFLKHIEIGEVVNFYSLMDLLKLNFSDDKIFKKTVNKLKKEGCKFESQNNGDIVWLVEKDKVLA